MIQTQQQEQKKNEWQLVDEIGRKLTESLRKLDLSCYPYEELEEAKNLVNQLKSLMIKETRDEKDKV